MSDSAPGEEQLRQSVRERYGGVAKNAGAGCCGSTDAGCGCAPSGSSSPDARTGGCCSGYSATDLASIPEGANLGLGCGNPTRLVTLRPGQVVLDLGSGAGVDCFVAAGQVGPSGRVIGVDMTPEMITRSRALARSAGRANVEFRLGEIEHLPVADASVDVVLSNCVINLAPDKSQVYREAFRVLRPGGELAVADVLATRPIPEEVRNDPAGWASCSSGALTRDEVTERLQAAGFDSIDVTVHSAETPTSSLQAQAEIGVVSADIRAAKPGRVRP